METPTFLKDKWNVLPPDAEHPYYRIRSTWPGSRFKIANIRPVVPDKPEVFAQETKAVASAIGSLPELYNELEAMVAYFQGHDLNAIGQKHVANACAVLRKAREEAS